MNRKWMNLGILAMGGGIIFQLPYIRLMFYRPLVAAMGLTDGQYGIIASAYGISAVLAYFFGGYIADRFSPRKLIAVSLWGTGICGLYMATFPGYKVNLILHIIMGMTTVLTYWAPMIKAVGSLGTSNEQGRMYGFLEGGRGVTSAIAGFIVLRLYKVLGEGTFAVGTVINFYAIASIICGVATWFLLSDNKGLEDTVSSTRIEPREIVLALKNRYTWIVGLIVFTTYVIFSTQGYLSPYLQDIYEVSIETTVFLGIVRAYIFQFLGGPFGGFIADKLLKSSSKFVRLGFVGIGALIFMFLRLSTNNSMVFAAISMMLFISLLVYAMRGVYWAIVDELDIDITKRGTIIGVASCIGFAPDMFTPALIGGWLDKYPGIDGYNRMFIFMMVMMVMGFGIATILMSELKKSRELDEKNIFENDIVPEK